MLQTRLVDASGSLVAISQLSNDSIATIVRNAAQQGNPLEYLLETHQSGLIQEQQARYHGVDHGFARETHGLPMQISLPATVDTTLSIARGAKAAPIQLFLPCYDERLRQLSIRDWTEVPVSNELATAALSNFFSIDHALLGYFDVDLFLSSLIERNSRFCSRFFVSALLYYAFVSQHEARQSARFAPYISLTILRNRKD